MSKKFNVKDIVDERRNELDHSPLFQPRKSDPVLPVKSHISDAPDEPSKIAQQNASKPESQNAGNQVFQQTGKLASQTSSKSVKLRFPTRPLLLKKSPIDFILRGNMP